MLKKFLIYNLFFSLVSKIFMNSYKEALITDLKLFTTALTKSGLPENYHIKYINLYFELNGTKQRIKYLVIADIWRVHKDTARNIIQIFEKYNVVRKCQQTDEKENNNRGYLFIEPLIHLTR